MQYLVREGFDITTVTKSTRVVAQCIDMALLVRDRTCVVPGCGRRLGLERDHFKIDYGDSGPTELKNLARLCTLHHDMKTHGGWRLRGGPGHWGWIPPAQPPSAGRIAADPQTRRRPGQGRSSSKAHDTQADVRGTFAWAAMAHRTLMGCRGPPKSSSSVRWLDKPGTTCSTSRHRSAGCRWCRSPCWRGTPSSRSRWPALCSSPSRRPRRRARCSTTSSSPWPRSRSSRRYSARSSIAAAGPGAPWSCSPQ